ncbi:MAG: hypothetical protein AAGC68_04090, partial [Verrucomicrobiota bacterium]
RGADRSGGFFEGSNDAQRTEHLGDINNTTSGSRNHGWAELAATLRSEGFAVEQITETAENVSGPSEGVHIDFESLDLSEYQIIVFGSNNAVYDSAAVDAIEQWIRGGGSALFISDANFGGDWTDASNSDQQFLDRFGLIMNQDRGTYTRDRSDGEFLIPDHPIFNGVDTFDGEGVTPISVGNLTPGVTATRLAGAQGQVRRNIEPFDENNNNQGPSSAANSQDAALVIATANDGKIAGHYDRNTFFNEGGVGSDITNFDNRQYAINLFHWLAGNFDDSDPKPESITASDGTSLDQVNLSWEMVPDATEYTVYRATTNSFEGASPLPSVSTTTTIDSTAEVGLTYFYWVTATIDSNETSPSPSDSGYRAVPAPTNLIASDGVSDAEIQLSWSGLSGATYRVFRATSNSPGLAQEIASPSTNQYSDPTGFLTPARPYFYWVEAILNGKVSEKSDSDSGYLSFLAISGVTASQNTNGNGIELSWNTVAGATEYRIYRSTDASFENAVVLTTVPGASHLDTTANPETPYYYWIEPVNQYGMGSVGGAVEGIRRLENYQPDLWVGPGTSGMLGDDRYGGGQGISLTGKKRRSMTGYFANQNDGTDPDRIRLQGTGPNRFFRLTYSRITAPSGNITAGILTGRYTSPELGQGESELGQVSIVPTRNTKRRKNTRRISVFLFGFSDNDPALVDSVLIEARSLRKRKKRK